MLLMLEKTWSMAEIWLAESNRMIHKRSFSKWSCYLDVTAFEVEPEAQGMLDPQQNGGRKLHHESPHVRLNAIACSVIDYENY